MRGAGNAERHIRMCKEHFGAFRLDLQREGFDVCFTEVGLSLVLSYLVWIENHFRRPRGGELIIHELLLGHKRSAGMFSFWKLRLC